MSAFRVILKSTLGATVTFKFCCCCCGWLELDLALVCVPLLNEPRRCGPLVNGGTGTSASPSSGSAGPVLGVPWGVLSQPEPLQRLFNRRERVALGGDVIL